MTFVIQEHRSLMSRLSILAQRLQEAHWDVKTMTVLRFTCSEMPSQDCMSTQQITPMRVVGKPVRQDGTQPVSFPQQGPQFVQLNTSFKLQVRLVTGTARFIIVLALHSEQMRHRRIGLMNLRGRDGQAHQ
jgi:hypothetical protein